MEYLKVYDEALPLGNRMAGKNVVVINRSEIVGRPLAAMLANDGADVYSVDLNGVFLMRRGRMLEVRLPPLRLTSPAAAGSRTQPPNHAPPAPSYPLCARPPRARLTPCPVPLPPLRRRTTRRRA
jgi:hypothetical protein